MVHDTARSGEDEVAELTRGQEIGDPLLDMLDLDVKARADDTALVDATNQLDHDLATTVVVNNLEFADVAWIPTRLEM